jgi:hypothetical protein
MADDIKVNPAPIQRNYNDVAVELTQLYYSHISPASIAEIQETYFKMYTAASYAGRGKVDLEQYLPK